MISAGPWGPKFLTFFSGIFYIIPIQPKILMINFSFRISDIFKKYPPNNTHLLNKLNFKALSLSKNFNNVEIKKYVYLFLKIYINIFFEILFSSALRTLLRAIQLCLQRLTTSILSISTINEHSSQDVDKKSTSVIKQNQ